MRGSRGGICDSVVGRVIATCVMAGALTACGGGDSGSGVGPDGQVHQGVGVSGTMTISPTSLTIVQGHSATATLSLALKGSSPGTITFASSALPSGITATFDPPSLTGSGSSTVTIAATTNAPILSGLKPYFVGFVGKDTLVLDGLAPSLDITVRNGRPGVAVIKAGSGSGTVTSSPAGITCGNTCNAQFDLEPITLTAVPAAGSAFTSWSGLCTGNTPVCTFTPKDFGNTVTATFTPTAAAISLSASPSPVTVQPGGSTTATLTVTRINGFAEPVALSVSAPVGITATANPTSITGTTSTLTVTAAASLAAGSYPVTITATGTGVTQQSITLPVQVPLPSSGGTIAFNYTNCEAHQVPVWFAVQNGTGPWTRVTPSNNTFSFALGPTGAYAVVIRNGPDTVTSVLYASAAEIASIAGANPCGAEPATGTKRITGTLGNSGSTAQGIFPTVVIGGAQYVRQTDLSLAFTLTEVPGGPRDLIAARINSAPNASRMIVRRNTNYDNNQDIPILDFGAATEAFAPPYGVLTPLNLGGDQISVDASLTTANGSSASYYSSTFLGQGGNTGYQGLPDSLLRPGDFHNVMISAASASGTEFRFASMLMHSVNTAALQIPFGPRAAGASAASVATAPYLRLRGQVSSQSTYTAGAEADFAQGTKTVSLRMTAAYLGAAPATWALDVPDLSGAGYDANWGLKSGSGAAWQVFAVSGTVLPFIGGSPVDNAQIMGAGARDLSASVSAAALPIRHFFGRRP